MFPNGPGGREGGGRFDFAPPTISAHHRSTPRPRPDSIFGRRRDLLDGKVCLSITREVNAVVCLLPLRVSRCPLRRS